MRVSMAAMRRKAMGAFARCNRRRLKARLTGPELRRQSVERLPLVREGKAKLVMLKSQ